jgi:diguanylate cyclase (GGDEF)-like protein
MATPSHPPPLADRPPSAGESPSGGWLSALSARGERDFRIALMFMIGLTGMLVVGGFAIYRFSSGNLIGGFVNLAIVLALGGILLWAAAGAATRHVGAVFIAAVTLAAISSVFVFGRTGLYWTFLVLWVSFVLAPPRLATLTNSALLLAVLVGNHALFGSGTEWTAYLVTGGLVTWVAWLAATRLERQHELLQALADEDPLTGAGNRRSLQRDLERRQAAGGRGVLALLDIDWFKQVNDEHGHAAGDRVLVGLVDLLGQRLRKVDGVYRIGGEEFVLLLPEARLEDAAPRLYALQVELNAGLSRLPGRATVSIGAAQSQSDEHWQDWLARADGALYQAKQGGRNRVVIDGGARPRQHERRAATRH